MKVRKAVFPVAGLGTRLLPASKVLAKEMLPIIDKPLIQYAVEEAIEAGCDTLVFVTNKHKHAIADHFDRTYELEARLEKTGKHELVRLVRDILPSHVCTMFVTQSEALGLGHAVLCAQHAIGNEPFAILLPDDLLWNPKGQGVLAQMTCCAEKSSCSVVAVENVPKEHTQRYGIVSIGASDGSAAQINAMVEKPKPELAPSTLAIVGRYVLSPKIFDYLSHQKPGAGGEIQLTDAIATMLSTERVLAYSFEGERFDCGNKLGVVTATLSFALSQPDIADEVRSKMRALLNS